MKGEMLMPRPVSSALERPGPARALLAPIAVALFVILWMPAARADCLPGPVCPSTVQPSAPLPTPVPSDPVGQAGGVVNQAQQAAQSAVNQVGSTIDHIVNPGGGGSGGGGGPGGGGKGGGGGAGSKSGRPSSAGTSLAPGSTVGAGGAGTTTSGSGTTSGTSAIERRGLFGEVGGAVARVAKQLSFPLALTVLVLLFALVQDRLDRSDPKLALARATPDVLRFE
jgi:hypothetical protein